MDGIKLLAGTLKEFDVEETNHCYTTAEPEILRYYDVNGNGLLLTNETFQEIEKEYNDFNRQEELQEKNYVTGFLGSILFSIVGIVAWVLLAIFLNRILSAMSIVIAYLGIRGYNFFRGSHGKFTNWIIILSNIIAILLANFLIVAVLLYQEGLTGLEAIFYEFQNNPNAQEIFNKNTAISFVLSFFVWVYLFFILQHKKLYIKPATSL